MLPGGPTAHGAEASGQGAHGTKAGGPTATLSPCTYVIGYFPTVQPFQLVHDKQSVSCANLCVRAGDRIPLTNSNEAFVSLCAFGRAWDPSSLLIKLMASLPRIFSWPPLRRQARGLIASSWSSSSSSLFSPTSPLWHLLPPAAKAPQPQPHRQPATGPPPPPTPTSSTTASDESPQP
jgi:hypothetical protein